MAHNVSTPTPSILSKAFDVLNAFNSRNRVMSLRDLALASGLPKSTVHRLLARLIELGAIEQEGAGYRIALSMFQLGALPPEVDMRDRALPHLAALHRYTRQTVHFGVLRGTDVVYLEKVPVVRSVSVISEIGARLPAHCTAVGKTLLAYEDPEALRSQLDDPLPRLTPRSVGNVAALLADLETIRHQGIAVEREEAQLGMTCFGAPVVVNGSTVAAVSASFELGSPLPKDLSLALRKTAAGIAAAVKAQLGDSRSMVL
ncbi:IclR family transcriptional regulator [Gordonia sp. NPDC127522]|uniref:IclR family transcriptional regulator n=1 Tax=Gordonia sp. NPDC127522 TaxID=3345390 RepID=UPI00362CFBEB